MYDKVNLWKSRATVGEHSPIARYLDEAEDILNHQTGEVKTFGRLGGLRVNLYIGGVSIVGSLAKFHFGNNVATLDRNTTAQAIERLQDALHLDLSEARVTGLEFGTNLMMMHPVSEYLPLLGAMPRQERAESFGTVYYQGSGKQHPKVFTFYDKIADANRKGMEYPESLQDTNLLRYEMRLNGRLPQRLNVPKVTASTLTESRFYRMMVQQWQEAYFSISKRQQIKTEYMSEIKNVTDAYDVFVARLLSMAGQDQITEYLQELKAGGVFDDKKYYTRLKKRLQEVARKAKVSVSDELVKELDAEIRNAGAYC